MKKANIVSIHTEFGKNVDPRSIEDRLGLRKGFIGEKTGIKNLHRYDSTEEFLRASMYACMQAVDKAGLDLNDVHGIYTPHSFTDYLSPTLSARLAKFLDKEDIIAQSVGHGCVGGLQALQAANNQLCVDSSIERHRNYLVLAGDHLTHVTNSNDYKTSALFSDATTAMVVSNEKSLGALEVQNVNTRTQAGKSLYALNIKNSSHNDYEGTHWDMDGREVFGFGVNAFKKAFDLLEIDPGNFDVVIPHQANLRMLEKIRDIYGLNNLYVDGVINHGNTSSSTVFAGLEDVINNTSAKDIAIVSFGSDLLYGSCSLKRL